MFNSRTTRLVLSCSLLLMLSGCAEFFGTHEGYEEGTFAPRMNVEGTATFEVVGISPSDSVSSLPNPP